MTTEVLSNNVFNKIRSKFGDVQLGDADGNVTADPKEAVFYDFEYTEDADTFGRMSISLADGESMKVYYNKNLTDKIDEDSKSCLLYTSPSPRDRTRSRMPSSA